MVWKWKSALIQQFFLFFFLLKTEKDSHRKPKTASTVQDKAGNNAKQQIQIPKMLLEPSRPEYKNTKHHLYVHETNKQTVPALFLLL